jgi:hypothetical protein
MFLTNEPTTPQYRDALNRIVEVRAVPRGEATFYLPQRQVNGNWVTITTGANCRPTQDRAEAERQLAAHAEFSDWQRVAR